MSKQTWNSVVDFVADLMLTIIAGLIVIGFVTFLMSLLLINLQAPNAVSGIRICISSILASVLLLYGTSRMTAVH